jgi:hypothetical protein
MRYLVPRVYAGAMASMNAGARPDRAARRTLIADALLAAVLAALLTVATFFASQLQPARRP